MCQKKFLASFSRLQFRTLVMMPVVNVCRHFLSLAIASSEHWSPVGAKPAHSFSLAPSRLDQQTEFCDLFRRWIFCFSHVVVTPSGHLEKRTRNHPRPQVLTPAVPDVESAVQKPMTKMTQFRIQPPTDDFRH